MNRNIPLYSKVYEKLLQEFETEVYKHGDQLPSESELANALHVSLITIRRAMQELANEGWVIRQPGRGTFVSKPKRIEQPVSMLTSFTADMVQNGIKPSSTLLTQEVILADEVEAEGLEIEKGTEVFHLSRVRNGNDLPVAIENAYIPLSVCPKLEEIDFTNESLYRILTENGVELVRSVQEFEPIILTSEQAKLLHVPPGTPALVRKAVSYDGEKPIELAETMYRKDRFRFVIETGRYAPKIVFVPNS